MDNSNDTAGSVLCENNDKSESSRCDDLSENVKATKESDSNNISDEKCDAVPENFEKSSCDITPNDDESTSASGITMSSVGAAAIFVTSSQQTPNEIDSSVEKKNQCDDDNRTSCDSTDGKSKAASAGLAFTIDFNDGKTVDNKKYKEIVERFQNRQQQQQQQRRHRRGVSLSKLDDTRKSNTSLNNVELCKPTPVDDSNIAVVSKPPFKHRPKIDSDAAVEVDKSNDAGQLKVTLRQRPTHLDQIQLDGKDSSKRHSWSPRSSLNYENASPHTQRHQNVPVESKRVETTGANCFQPKSTTLQRALESTSLRQLSNNAKPLMQSKLKKAYESQAAIVTAPLEYVQNSDDEGSIGVVSDAGTYTLDGDNYTEEEKERMSIDKLARKNHNLTIESKRMQNEINKQYSNLRKQPQKEISLGDASLKMRNENRCKNVVQANYSQPPTKLESNNSIDKEHTPPSKASKVSYLEKIKSRVKTIGDRTFHKGSKASGEKQLPNSGNDLQVARMPSDELSPVDADHGTFTSITACGVLNKYAPQEYVSTVNSRNSNRKNSLTKLQIDSSEYIQPKYNIDEKLLNSYTDYEKAKQSEYQLNIFSTSTSYTTSSTTISPPQTDDNLSVECIDDKPVSIKTAPTKNDWIQEWAKNARRRNNLLAASATGSLQAQQEQKTNANRLKNITKNGDRMSQSYDVAYSKYTEEFGDDVIEDSSDDGTAHLPQSINTRNSAKSNKVSENQKSGVLRPPISPTKIPSPMHIQLRARSSSANRSFRNSNADLENLDTEMYLEKTAAAISSLQRLHRKNSSPQGPLSPMRKVAPMADFNSSSVQNSFEKAVNLRPVHLHKRNLSLDVSRSSENRNHNEYYDSDEFYEAQQLKDQLSKRHTRHNSYENKLIQMQSPKRSSIDQTMLPMQQKAAFAEQQRLLNKYFGNTTNNAKEHARRSSIGNGNAVGDGSSNSPIKRSSSFCNKNNYTAGGGGNVAAKTSTPTANKKPLNRRVAAAGNLSLEKSASSSSFKKLMTTTGHNYSHNYANDNNGKFYVNGEDDLHPNSDEYNLLYSSDDSDNINGTNSSSNKYGSDVQCVAEPPISRTRYNKAFLMRMEQNKQIASGAPGKGVVACPNTPELPRRSINPRASFRDPTSMPRDSSLSRMKQDIPNLQTTKKALTQTASKESSSTTSSSSKQTQQQQQRVLPKYMDISKYKPVQGQNFLKRDETKSTLINRNELRKSPSAIGLSKTDPMRTSGRVKSAGAKPSTPISLKETKAREVELAMWRRRATYDPMKAAAEGRKKQQEDAKKITQKTNKFGESSAVLRSQSFHSGVGQFGNYQLREKFSEDSFHKNRWTTISTESSDEEEFGEMA